MRKKLVIALISALLSAVILFGGCTVPGEIGRVEDFFDSPVKYKKYIKHLLDDGTFEILQENGEDTDTAALTSTSMEYDTYSVIELTFNRSKAKESIITTLTFEIQVEEDTEFSLLIETDDDSKPQYDSGRRRLAAGTTKSFVITGLEYTADTRKLYFRNELSPDEMLAEGEDYEEYTGTSARWRLCYMQIVYQLRSDLT